MRKWQTIACGVLLVTLSMVPGAFAQDNGLDKFGFGVGLGFQWNVGGADLVEAASIDGNGYVRVDKRANTAATFVGEMHVFPKPFKDGALGIGPFVAAQFGSNEVIEAIGLGVMFGIKKTDRQAFGLGVGYASQLSKKVLGDEFVENAKAPVGPDGKPLPIRLAEKDNGAIMVVLSFVF